MCTYTVMVGWFCFAAAAVPGSPQAGHIQTLAARALVLFPRRYCYHLIVVEGFSDMAAPVAAAAEVPQVKTKVQGYWKKEIQRQKRQQQQGGL